MMMIMMIMMIIKMINDDNDASDFEWEDNLLLMDFSLREHENGANMAAKNK